MKVEIINPVDYPHWDDLVLATNDYSFFHSSQWAKVLHRSYRYTPTYFTSTEQGKLLAVMPVMEIKSILTGRRGVSLAFSDYCEPIVAERDAFESLLGEVIDYGRKSGWKHIEFRGGQKFLPDAPVSACYFGHSLVLDGNEQHLFSCFRSNTRWSIRKAVQEGVEIHFDRSLQAVEDFYRLHCMTRKHHDVPPQPFHFFKHIHDCILAENLGFVVLASYRGTLVSGAVFFHFGNKALYKFSASDFKHRNLGASNLILWEAIKWYSRNGFVEFCFGRTDQDNEGLRKFKTGWGTTEKDIFYYRYDIDEGRFAENDPSAKTTYSRYLGKLPASMLKAVGYVLYRHMG